MKNSGISLRISPSKSTTAVILARIKIALALDMNEGVELMVTFCLCTYGKKKKRVMCANLN